jgi:hypothetical protein
MYTVIVPTMWFGEALQHMLPRILEHKLVAEVLLFDNNPTERPSWVVAHDKLQIITTGKNEFVNPCWNRGVELSKTEDCILYSDDVLFDTKIIDWVSDKIKDGMGFIGPEEAMYSLVRVMDATKDLSIEDKFKYIDIKDGTHLELIRRHSKKIHLGWAMLLFMKKSMFIPIPEDFKIWFGDNWMWAINMKTGKKPLVIENFKLAGACCATSNSTREDIATSRFHDDEMLGVKSVDARVAEVLP